MPTSADDVSRDIAGFLRSKAGRDARISPAATAFIGFAAAAAGYLSRAIGPTRAGEAVE
jgi:hypothetical protein